MMHNIRSRLQAVERSKVKNNTPELVMIFYDEKHSSWVAKEQYVKKNAKGQPIKGTGKNKFIRLTSPDAYEPPDGFNGTIIMEGDLADE